MNHKETNISTLAWVDLIRCLSIILVVVIHTSGPLMYKWGEIPFSDWITGDFFISFSRASVPMLFMVSGYLLLSKQESLSDFFLKRFRKVLVPLIFWSAFYLIWQNGYKTYTYFNAIKAIIYEIVTGPASYHFWFLYELLAIYLFVPVFRKFVRSADKIHLWYVCLLWFVFGPVQKMLERWVNFEFAIELGFFTEYIGYFLLGYLLGQEKYDKRWIRAAGFLFFVSVGYTVWGTYSLAINDSDYNDYYQWYLTLNAALASVGAFIVFKRIGEVIRGEILFKWMREFAEASFGIYLVHIFFLISLKRMGYDVFSGPAMLTIPILSLVVVLLSWLSVFVMQKIPFLKSFVPK